jgi:hypothetical protein
MPQDELEWYRPLRLLAQLGEWEAVLPLYWVQYDKYPSATRTTWPDHDFFAQHYDQILTKQYWEWYGHHQVRHEELKQLYLEVRDDQTR